MDTGDAEGALADLDGNADTPDSSYRRGLAHFVHGHMMGAFTNIALANLLAPGSASKFCQAVEEGSLCYSSKRVRSINQSTTFCVFRTHQRSQQTTSMKFLGMLSLNETSHAMLSWNTQRLGFCSRITRSLEKWRFLQQQTLAIHLYRRSMQNSVHF